jgi:hypothetical protein
LASAGTCAAGDWSRSGVAVAGVGESAFIAEQLAAAARSNPMVKVFQYIIDLQKVSPSL